MLWTAFRVFIAMTILTGMIYPFLITEIVDLTMPKRSSGSLIVIDDKIRGSVLIAQPFNEDKYFWPRPSANDYNPMHSGGSNLGPTNKKLKELVDMRADKLRSSSSTQSKQKLPTELLYSSGSGLDPHITRDALFFQLERIIKARQLSDADRKQLEDVILKQQEGRQLGFLGQPYFNVLKMNILLDTHFPVKHE